jgi:hypothetical protein
VQASPSTPAQKTPSAPAQASPSAPAQRTPSTPAQTQPSTPALTEQDSGKNAWKNKRVYLGGFLGGGSYQYKVSHSSGYYYGGYHETNSGWGYERAGLFAFGAQAELSLFSWIALELDLGLAVADDVLPVLPLLVKIGGRPGPVELFGNIGYTIGVGFTIGATLGFHAGPGVLFGEFLFIAGESDSVHTVFTGLLGYKVGLGNKK